MGLDLLFHDSRHTRQLVSFQKQTDAQTQRTHSRAISRKRTHLLEGLKKDRKILCHNHRSARYFGWRKLDILVPSCVCKIFYGKIFWDTVDKPTSTGMSEPLTLAVRGSPVSPCKIRQHTSAHASVVRSPSATARMVTFWSLLQHTVQGPAGRGGRSSQHLVKFLSSSSKGN